MHQKGISEQRERGMANGMRNLSRRPLSASEISEVMLAIRRIEADPAKFIINEPSYIGDSTCYNYYDDIIYVTANVLPDTVYGDSHPRDMMSVAAVLAHEYYGHRTYRSEYLSDAEISKRNDTEFHKFLKEATTL